MVERSCVCSWVWQGGGKGEKRGLWIEREREGEKKIDSIVSDKRPWIEIERERETLELFD